MYAVPGCVWDEVLWGNDEYCRNGAFFGSLIPNIDGSLERGPYTRVTVFGNVVFGAVDLRTRGSTSCLRQTVESWREL